MSKNLVRKNGADLSLSNLSRSMNLTSKLLGKNQDEFYLSWWDSMPIYWKDYFINSISNGNKDEFNKKLSINLKYIIEEMQEIEIVEDHFAIFHDESDDMEEWHTEDYYNNYNDASSCYDVDLSWLKMLKSLQKLHIGKWIGFNMECILELVHLNELSCSLFSVNDASILVSLSRLKKLSICINSSESLDLYFLNHIINLEELDISTYSAGRELSNLYFSSPLDKLSKLRRIALSNLNIANYPTLSCLTSLEELFFSDSYGSALSFISENFNLKKLNLRIKNAQLCSVLNRLININELSIFSVGGNLELGFLSNYYKLTNLSLYQFSNIYGLKNIQSNLQLLKLPSKCNLFNEDIDELKRFKEQNIYCSIELV